MIMKEEKLKKLSIDELKKQEKSQLTLIGIFIPLILGLFFFVLRDYFRGEELDLPILIIAICTVGGMVSVFPNLKAIRKELQEREN